MQNEDSNMQDILQQQNLQGTHDSRFPSTGFTSPVIVQRTNGSQPVSLSHISPSNHVIYDSPPIQPNNVKYQNNPIPSQPLIPSTTRLAYPSQTQVNTIAYSSSSPNPITVSGLVTGQHNKILSKYPTLHPIVNPQVPQSRVIQPYQKSRVVVSQTQRSAEQMKGTSKIQFLPFEKKVVEYRQQQRIQRIPRKHKILNYQQQVITETVPKQITKIDYYAVQHIKGYLPQYIPQKKVVMVQKAVPFKKIQYIPVTRQVFHGAPMGSPLSGGQFNTNSLNMIATPQLYNIANPEVFLPNNGQFISRPPPPTSFYPSTKKLIGSTGQTTTCVTLKQEMSRKINSINDNYDTYVPSFKY